MEYLNKCSIYLYNKMVKFKYLILLIDSMKQDVLEKLGLSKNEARVYLALLKLGSASVTDIAKSSGVHRVNTYDALERLMERGLVSAVVKINKKFYEAADPDRILDIVKEKEEVIEKTKKILPELKLDHRFAAKRQEVHHFKGREGLKSVFEDITKTLKKGDEWLIFGSAGKGAVILPNFMDKWEKERVKAGIRLKMIFNDAKQGRIRAQQLSKLKLTEVGYLPKGLISPSDVYIYGNKSTINLWSEDTPLSIMVENKEIADSFRSFFNWFWKISKK